MTDPAHPHPDPAIERLVAERTAELTEMLAHLASCWDEEKRLLARQLHDSLGSSMTALTMHLALLTQHIPAENKAMRDRSAQMKGLLTTIIETNRKMQLALWNDKLEFLGLRAALAELVPAFGAERGVQARASLPDEDGNYSRTQGVVLLRCAEEGLRNAVAHGRASEIEVILDDDGEQAMLTVRDNGGGPQDPQRAMSSRGCHGLRLLRERARFLGGELVLARGETGGAVLRMTLPKQPIGS
jgi:signal transduction histidine kinase